MINSFSENSADTQRQQKPVQGHKYVMKLRIVGCSTKFTSLFCHASELAKKMLNELKVETAQTVLCI